MYFGEKTLLQIPNPQHAALDEHFTATLVQLADADDARVQLRDLKDIRQRVVLPVLALEDDGATASNLHHRAITELYRPSHTAIELGEGLPGAGHVVAGAGV